MNDKNDLERLLQLNKFFDELPLPEDRTYTKSPHMLRAKGNASFITYAFSSGIQSTCKSSIVFVIINETISKKSNKDALPFALNI